MIKHQSCSEHKAAVEADAMRRTIVRAETMLEPQASDSPAISASDKTLFATVYFAAQRGFANDSVNGILELQRLNGAECSYVDLHSTMIADVQCSLAALLDGQLEKKRTDSNFFGLLVDESTDISVHKTLIMYLRYVCHGVVTTDFIGNVRVRDGKAETLTAVIEAELLKLGINLSQVVGFGSDGASVMTGRNTGVGARLLQSCPGLVHIHCVAHRLNLACVDAMRKNKYLELVKENINFLFSYFHVSSLRSDKLQALQNALGEPMTKLKHAIDIRWLAMYDAVVAVHTSYSSLVGVLIEEQANKQLACKGKAVLKFITQYNFPAVIALLSDVLKIVTRLSKKFQSDDIDLSSIKPSVSIALSQIRSLDESPGSCMRDFFENLVFEGDSVTYRGVALAAGGDEQDSFVSIRSSYIDSVIDALSVRLINDSTDALKLFGVIEPQSDCSADLTDHLDSIGQKFGSAIHVAELSREMQTVSDLKSGCYSGYSMQAFAKALILRHSAELPQAAKLSELALCIPVSTAVCECGFSLQNWIKNKHRNSLNDSTLQI